MRAYLLTAPRWVASVVLGLLFGVGMTVYFLVRDRQPVFAVISGAIGGVVFGAVMGRYYARQAGEVRAALGPLALVEQRAAVRASAHGPVPRDLQVRQAAIRLAQHQLHQLSRQRTRGIVAIALADGLYIVLALTQSPWWWISSAMFSSVLATQAWMPGHLRRRIDLLQVDQPDAGTGAELVFGPS